MTVITADKEVVPAHESKRLARLAAVQGLYRIALTQCPAEEVIRDFRINPSEMLNEKTPGSEPAPDFDQELFATIVRGVSHNLTSVDEMIAGAVGAKLSVERLEALLRAILRGGVFELHHHGVVPAGVIINDYVDVTHAFFNDREPGLVNAILDRLAKKLR